MIKVLSSGLRVTQTMLKQAKGMKAVGILEMKPYEFLRLTSKDPLNILNDLDRVASLDDYNKGALEGENIHMPFLYVDITSGAITGHEGRHRCAACIYAGIQSVEVAIIPRFGGKSVNEIKDGGAMRKVEIPDIPSVWIGQFKPITVNVDVTQIKPF